MTAGLNQRSYSRARPRFRRRGASAAECVAAAVLLAAVLSGLIPMVTAASAVRESTHLQQIAGLELANAMERLHVLHRSGQPVASAARNLEISEAAAAELPDARLEAVVTALEGEAAGQRITLRLTWTNPHRRTAVPAELHAFFFDEEAAQ